MDLEVTHVFKNLKTKFIIVKKYLDLELTNAFKLLLTTCMFVKKYLDLATKHTIIPKYFAVRILDLTSPHTSSSRVDLIHLNILSRCSFFMSNMIARFNKCPCDTIGSPENQRSLFLSFIYMYHLTCFIPFVLLGDTFDWLTQRSIRDDL